MSVGRSAITNLAGTILRSLISFVSQPLLIRLLGLDQYGRWVVLVSLSMLATLADFGLVNALSVFLAEHRATGSAELKQATIFSTLSGVTVIGLSVSIGCFAFLGYGARALFPQRSTDVAMALGFLTCAVVPRLWQQWLVGYSAGLSRYDLIANGETFNQILLNAGWLTIASLSPALHWLAAWYLVATLVTVAYHWFLLRRSGELISFRGRFQQSRDVFRFASLTWVTNVGALLFSRADRLVLNAVLGPVAVGVYSAAVAVVSKINELAGIAIQPLLPAFADANASGDGAKMQQLAGRGLRLNCFIILSLMILVVWGAPWIALIMAPAAVGDVTDLLRLMAPLYALYTMAGIGYYTLMALRRAAVSAFCALGGSVLTLVAMWHLSSSLGLPGAAVANGAYAVIWIMNVIAARYIGWSWPSMMRRFAPFLALLVVTVLAERLLRPYAGVGVNGAGFALSLAALAFLVRTELREFKKNPLGYFPRLQ
jgi:O-antigen/teichoic acid export membrane protein